jgi:putative phosphoribosyl transferase
VTRIDREVHIDAGEGVVLAADLICPESPRGVVLFSHGSGSGRHSPRNRYVAQRLNEHGLATLMIDLLTEGEEREDAHTGHLRFDVGMLADRLNAAIKWIRQDPEMRALPVGLFGASTGAAAAIVAAARRPDEIRTVVSRGGRPDLAGDALSHLHAPTLLIVGDLDPVVRGLNTQALAQMSGSGHEIVTVPGASHLFEEAGKLEAVAALAADWFEKNLANP